MLRSLTKLMQALVHTWCVLALVIACGSFEALHETAHFFSGTVCEDHAGLSIGVAKATVSAGAHSSGASAARANVADARANVVDAHAARANEASLDAHDSCWLGSVLAHLSHSSLSGPSTLSAATIFAAKEFSAFALTEDIVSRYSGTWHAPRGPPRV